MQAVKDLQGEANFFWSSKITVSTTPHSGNAVLATEPLRAGELIIRVPLRLLVNVSTVTSSPHAAIFPEDFSTHELLAIELIARRRRGDDAWVASMPADFAGMPVSWPASAREELPKRYLRRIAEQAREVADLQQKCAGFASREEVLWAWQAVNSRCLYWAAGGMTLAPVIDFLNHNPDQSQALRIESSAVTGMAVYTTHSYEPGEELTFSYGPHENGFLLTEYGFILNENPWEFVDISEMLSKIVPPERERFLRVNSYWGDWTVDRHGSPSFRVEVALAATTPAASERALLALMSGSDAGSQYEEASRTKLKAIAEKLQPLYNELAAHAQALDTRRLYAGYLDILSRV